MRKSLHMSNFMRDFRQLLISLVIPILSFLILLSATTYVIAQNLPSQHLSINASANDNSRNSSLAIIQPQVRATSNSYSYRKNIISGPRSATFLTRARFQKELNWELKSNSGFSRFQGRWDGTYQLKKRSDLEPAIISPPSSPRKVDDEVSTHQRQTGNTCYDGRLIERCL